MISAARLRYVKFAFDFVSIALKMRKCKFYLVNIHEETDEASENIYELYLLSVKLCVKLNKTIIIANK